MNWYIGEKPSRFEAPSFGARGGQERKGKMGTIVRKMHCKKGLAVFTSPAGMSLIKLFLGGNNLVFPAQREFGQ